MPPTGYRTLLIPAGQFHALRDFADSLEVPVSVPSLINHLIRSFQDGGDPPPDAALAIDFASSMRPLGRTRFHSVTVSVGALAELRNRSYREPVKGFAEGLPAAWRGLSYLVGVWLLLAAEGTRPGFLAEWAREQKKYKSYLKEASAGPRPYGPSGTDVSSRRYLE